VGMKLLSILAISPNMASWLESSVVTERQVSEGSEMHTVFDCEAAPASKPKGLLQMIGASVKPITS